MYAYSDAQMLKAMVILSDDILNIHVQLDMNTSTVVDSPKLLWLSLPLQDRK